LKEARGAELTGFLLLGILKRTCLAFSTSALTCVLLSIAGGTDSTLGGTGDIRELASTTDLALFLGILIIELPWLTRTAISLTTLIGVFTRLTSIACCRRIFVGVESNIALHAHNQALLRCI